ncbi:hypothetical protein N9P17_08495 [Tateyamaria sp.]|nr:hypothetical protein [Tateyamaria sp.]
MIRVVAFLVLVSLAACGVDGRPLLPLSSSKMPDDQSDVDKDGTIGVSQGSISVGIGVL